MTPFTVNCTGTSGIRLLGYIINLPLLQDVQMSFTKYCILKNKHNTQVKKNIIFRSYG